MFYGRSEQLEQLGRLLLKHVGSFVTCRGRRRVGKSTLIEKFARDCGARFLKLEGVKPEFGCTDFAEEARTWARFRGIQNGCKYAETFQAHRIHGYMPDFKVLP